MKNDDDSEIISDLSDFAQDSSEYFGTQLTRYKNEIAFVGGEQGENTDALDTGVSKTQLTVNVSRAYCNQVINQYKDNPYAASITGRVSASVQKAEDVQGLVRGIESRGNISREAGLTFDRMMKGGRGYLVLTNDYMSNDSWDQELKFKGILRSDMVIWDKLSTDITGADCGKVAVVEHESLYVAQETYGADIVDQWEGQNSPLINTAWTAPKGSVEIVTFYRKRFIHEKLYQGKDGKPLKEADVRKNVSKNMKSRMIKRTVIEVFKIVGTKIVHRTTVPLSRIPVYAALGEMIDTSSGLDWVGLPHFSKDANRLVNWTASLTAERIARGKKATTYVPMKSIAAYKDVWDASNIIAPAYLPYDHMDKKGNPIPGPTDRDESAQIGDTLTAMNTYEQAISSILGMPAPGMQMSGPANETAAAVLTKARSADMANFQFFDNMAETMKEVARGVLEWQRVIYTGQRAVPVENDEGKIQMDVINMDEANIIPDEYEVSIDSGPMLATNRKEALAGLLALAQLWGPQAAMVMAPETLENSDFPGAQKISKKMAMYLQTEMGISADGEARMQDPEAVQALQVAQQTAEQLKAQLDQLALEKQETFGYINQLHNALQSKEYEAAVNMAMKRMELENKTEVAIIKETGESQRQSQELESKGMIARGNNVIDLRKIQADNEQATQSALVDMEKIRTQQKPDITLNVTPPELEAELPEPSMTSVDGLRSDLL